LTAIGEQATSLKAVQITVIASCQTGLIFVKTKEHSSALRSVLSFLLDIFFLHCLSKFNFIGAS